MYVCYLKIEATSISIGTRSICANQLTLWKTAMRSRQVQWINGQFDILLIAWVISFVISLSDQPTEVDNKWKKGAKKIQAKMLVIKLKCWWNVHQKFLGYQSVFIVYYRTADFLSELAAVNSLAVSAPPANSCIIFSLFSRSNPNFSITFQAQLFLNLCSVY